TVQVGNNDLVLDIDSLDIRNSGNFKVERNGTGRLFLFVNDSFNLSNNAKLSGGAEDEGFIYVFYLGEDKFKPNNSSQFNASLFCSRADIEISNSARMGKIVTKGEKVDLKNSSLSVENIYATQADVTFHNSAVLAGGVITGGQNVVLHNSVSIPGFIYAPLANTTLNNSASVHGTTIVKNLYMGNSSIIEGPPVTILPALEIPFPVFE
ncbi:MAG TPA: hypothetical protein P5560_14700, partial [Thermotogota bacterium]|nr:hypothetical protein [Thermotogota bacterium]